MVVNTCGDLNEKYNSVLYIYYIYIILDAHDLHKITKKYQIIIAKKILESSYYNNKKYNT